MDKESMVLDFQRQQIQGIRLILQGISILTGNMAEVLEMSEVPGDLLSAGKDQMEEAFAADVEEAKNGIPAKAATRSDRGKAEKTTARAEKAVGARQAAPSAVGEAKQAAPSKPEKAAEPPKQMDVTKPDEFFDEILSKEKIKKDDVQRAMGFMLMALGRQGKDPSAIGEALAQFQGARCLSELREEDYRGYVEAIRAL